MIYASAISSGLDSRILEDMTVGGVVDYIVTYNHLHGYDKIKAKPKVRMATQADFDNF